MLSQQPNNSAVGKAGSFEGTLPRCFIVRAAQIAETHATERHESQFAQAGPTFLIFPFRLTAVAPMSETGPCRLHTWAWLRRQFGETPVPLFAD
jgi:hypothetical protein